VKKIAINGTSLFCYPTIALFLQDMAESWRSKLQIQYQCDLCGAKKTQLQKIGETLPLYCKAELILWSTPSNTEVKPPKYKNFRQGIVPGWSDLTDYPVFLDPVCTLHVLELGTGPMNFEGRETFLVDLLLSHFSGSTKSLVPQFGTLDATKAAINTAYQELLKGNRATH